MMRDSVTHHVSYLPGTQCPGHSVGHGGVHARGGAVFLTGVQHPVGLRRAHVMYLDTLAVHSYR